MEEIKDRLKTLRKALNLKQREVADRLEIRVGVIGSWESGCSPIPRARIYQICNEYKVRREWLETGEGEMFEARKETDAEEAKSDLFKRILTVLTDEEIGALEREINRRKESS